MKLKLAAIFMIIFTVAAAAAGQDAAKITIVDPAGSLTGNQNVLRKDELRGYFLKTVKRPAKLTPSTETCTSDFYIKDSVEGFFTARQIRSTAFLYEACDPNGAGKFEGIIILREDGPKAPELVAHYSYDFRSDVKLLRIKDLNNNGADELAAVAQRSSSDPYEVRILEFAKNKFVSFGQLSTGNAPPAAKPKLFAKRFPDGSVKYYVQTVGRKAADQSVVESEPAETAIKPDETVYVKGGGSFFSAVLRHSTFFVFAAQLLAFAGLILYLVYHFIRFLAEDSTKKETEKRAREARRTGAAPPFIEDDLPHLTPINCVQCGAPMPLRENELSCPRCGAKTAPPAGYFDVAKTREAIRSKLHRAEKSFKRAIWLSSGAMRAALGLAAVLLAISLGIVFVLINKGSFEPYQSYLFGQGSFRLIGTFGSFSSCFWIVSLLFGFAVWSPRLRKALPTIESAGETSAAENAECAQCGGGIAYEPGELATLCGYCGVETYRAKLGWKLRKLTNKADEKAEFSLIEAQKSVDDAKWEITGTPVIFAALLLLIGVVAGALRLLAALYELLPAGLRGFLEAIGDFF